MKTTFTILLFFAGYYLLAQPSNLIFVFLHKKSDAEKLSKERLDTLMEGHFNNIKRLAKEGKLTAAGPFDGGGGLFIFNSDKVDQVQEWLKTDPAVRANRWNVEILPYQPLIGSVCKVEEPYDMVQYHFVRFWPEIKKFTVHEAPQLIVQHEDYWKNQNHTTPFITFASFAEDDGDMLVSATAIDESVLVNDPAIRTGLIQFEKKMLWIAKGSFCEKTDK